MRNEALLSMYTNALNRSNDLIHSTRRHRDMSYHPRRVPVGHYLQSRVGPGLRDHRGVLIDNLRQRNDYLSEYQWEKLGFQIHFVMIILYCSCKTQHDFVYRVTNCHFLGAKLLYEFVRHKLKNSFKTSLTNYSHSVSFSFKIGNSLCVIKYF